MDVLDAPTAYLPEGFSLCRICGGTIGGWRYYPDGHREPLGLDGLLHACPSRMWRRHWRQRFRRVGKRAVLAGGVS